MDNKVLDEAVRIGVNAAMLEVGAFEFLSDEAQSDIVRAALLAGVKVLLGEPVACDVLAPDGSLVAGKVSIDYADDILRRYEWDNCHKSNFLYAPSLGEGDGR